MKREPGNCPYRKLPRADKENSASCDLLARLSGIELHDPLCQVSEDNCEYCCGEPVVASPTTLNPGVASYLFNLTCKVIQAGGVEGCSVKSAEELQTLATRNLRWGESEKQPSRRPEFDRPCLFLGDPVTYGGVVALLVGVAASACLVPALRATRVEPVTALRDD